MSIIPYLKNLYSYNHWANMALIDQLAAMPDPGRKAVEVMAHIVGAEYLWLSRLHGDAAEMAVWPTFSLGELKARADALPAIWQRLIDNQRTEKLLRPVAYTNSKGEPWGNRVHEILTHVLLHSAYHRGQIAAEIRGHGEAPILTDFIHAARQGLFDTIALDTE